MNLREHVMETVAAVEVTVPAGDLLELLDERDALKDRVSMLEFRLGFGVSDAPIVPRGPDVQVNEDGSIYGGSDIQDGDDSETVPVEPPAGDCSCKAPVADRIVLGGKLPRRDDLERAVCGSRQPNGQVVESPAPVPVPKEKPFTADKGKGKPSEHVVPWRALYSPNQCRLVLHCLSEGMHRVTAAAKANVTRETVNDIAKAYRVQIEHMAGMNDKEREHFLDSLYRQMLARWVAAGNDPKYQPEAPLPNKTITEAAGTYQAKGKAGKL